MIKTVVASAESVAAGVIRRVGVPCVIVSRLQYHLEVVFVTLGESAVECERIIGRIIVCLATVSNLCDSERGRRTAACGGEMNGVYELDREAPVPPEVAQFIVATLPVAV